MKTSTSLRPEITNFYSGEVYGSDLYAGSCPDDFSSQPVATTSFAGGITPSVIWGGFGSCTTQVPQPLSEPYFLQAGLGNPLHCDDTTPASGEALLRRAIWKLSVVDVKAEGKLTHESAQPGFDRDQVRAKKLSASVLRSTYHATRSRFCQLFLSKDNANRVPAVLTPVSPAVAAHLAYLDRMADRAVVSRQLADFARVVWHAVEIATNNALVVPAASAFEGGPIRYTWRHAGQWLTVAISEGGLCEWTYRNKAADELWGENSTAGALPSVALKDYMTRLVG